MQLEQKQTLSQKLVLTQTMRQSLDCLQLSAPELSEYVQEVALSNPLLDVQSPTYYETELPSETAPAEREPLEVRETDSWRGVTSSGMEDVQDFTAFLTREKTFRDHLTEQIGQMKLVDDELLRLCRFLIDCLDERGYPARAGPLARPAGAEDRARWARNARQAQLFRPRRPARRQRR